MRLQLISIFFLASTVTSLGPEIDRWSLDRGVVILKQDDIVLSGSFWTLAINLDLTPMLTLLANFSTTILQLTGHLAPVPVDLPNATGFQQILASHGTSLRARAKMAVLDINELQASQRLSRQRRALIGVVGSAARYLFGVATESQIAGLSAQIDKIRMGTNVLIHAVGVQASVINKTLTEVALNREALGTLTAVTRTVMARLHALENRITLVASIQSLQVFLDLVETQLAHLHQILLEALNHRLSPALIAPEQLAEHLIQIRDQLPQGMDLILPPRLDSIPQYYELIAVTAYHTPTGLRFFASIPLQSPFSAFHLFRMLPFPVPLPHSNLSLAIHAVQPFFAITQDKQLYMSLSHQDVQHCLGWKPRVCPPRMHIWRNPAQSCEHAIFTGNAQLTSALCETRLYVRHTPIFYHLNADGKWIFSVPEPQTLTIVCPQSQPGLDQTQKIRNTGVLDLPPGCTAHGPQYVLPPHFMAQSQLVRKFQIDVQPPPLPSILQTPAGVWLNNLTETQTRHLHKFLANLSHLPDMHATLSLASVQSQLERAEHLIDDPSPSSSSFSPFPDFHWTFWLLPIAALCLLFLLWKKWKRPCPLDLCSPRPRQRPVPVAVWTSHSDSPKTDPPEQCRVVLPPCPRSANSTDIDCISPEPPRASRPPRTAGEQFSPSSSPSPILAVPRAQEPLW